MSSGPRTTAGWSWLAARDLAGDTDFPKLTVWIRWVPGAGYMWGESQSAERPAAVMAGRRLRPGQSGHGL